MTMLQSELRMKRLGASGIQVTRTRCMAPMILRRRGTQQVSDRFRIAGHLVETRISCPVMTSKPKWHSFELISDKAPRPVPKAQSNIRANMICSSERLGGSAHIHQQKQGFVLERIRKQRQDNFSTTFRFVLLIWRQAPCTNLTLHQCAMPSAFRPTTTNESSRPAPVKTLRPQIVKLYSDFAFFPGA